MHWTELGSNCGWMPHCFSALWIHPSWVNTAALWIHTSWVNMAAAWLENCPQRSYNTGFTRFWYVLVNGQLSFLTLQPGRTKSWRHTAESRKYSWKGRTSLLLYCRHPFLTLLLFSLHCYDISFFCFFAYLNRTPKKVFCIAVLIQLEAKVL